MSEYQNQLREKYEMFIYKRYHFLGLENVKHASGMLDQMNNFFFFLSDLKEKYWTREDRFLPRFYSHSFSSAHCFC